MKEKSLTENVMDCNLDDGNLFFQSFTVRTFFITDEISKQSVKDTKAADAKTKVRCQKI